METVDTIVLGLFICFGFIIVAVMSSSTVVTQSEVVTINGTNEGAVDVYVQDQTTQVIDLYFTQLKNNISLVNDASAGDRSIIISSINIPVQEDVVCLKEGRRFSQPEIVSVTALGGNLYNVTLDTPLDFDYTTSGNYGLRIYEMNVDGSTTPQFFDVSIEGLDETIGWDIYAISCTMTDSTDMDSSTFGGLPALTNGLYLYLSDGENKNIFNAKSNSELHLRTDIEEYTPKAPAGSYGYHFEKLIRDRNGVALRVQPHNGTTSTLSFVVQDDLTGLNSFKCVAKGHEVE